MSFFSQSTETQLRLIIAGLVLAGCGGGGSGDGGGGAGATLPGNDSQTPIVAPIVEEVGALVSMTVDQLAIFTTLATEIGHPGKTPPKIRYQHAAVCHDGSVCCLATDPRFSGFYHQNDRTIDLIIPEEAEPGCRQLISDTVFRHESIHDITQNFDHTDPAFCEYSNTCCPTPGHPVGECTG